jgi:hypothetical protein
MSKRPVSLHFKALSAALLLVAAGQAAAAGANMQTTIGRTLMAGDDRWGGCMARLVDNPQNQLPSCANWWVSFSCSGDFAEPVQAYRMLDQAQLALAANKRVRVWFQDDKKHNGYCYANRIDILPN